MTPRAPTGVDDSGEAAEAFLWAVGKACMGHRHLVVDPTEERVLPMLREQWIASAGEDATVCLWTCCGHHLRTLAATSAVTAVCFSTDAALLASGCVEGGVG